MSRLFGILINVASPNRNIPPVPAHYHSSISYTSSHPLSTNPPIEEFQSRFRLIVRYHMSRSMDSYEREITTALNLPDLAAATNDVEVFEFSLVEALLARPV